jgi:predicted RNA polymerase sigma factor
LTATGAIEAVWRIEQPKLAARLARYPLQNDRKRPAG